MKRFLTFVTALMLVSPGAFSQYIRINPDKVSPEELSMNVYEPDTTAALVLLYRHINVTVGPSAAGEIGCDRQVYERWKVMKESGKDQIDYEIFYANSDKQKDEVRDIRAVTYNLDPDGSMISHKISRRNIYREKYSEGVYRLSFAPESVQVGSVVEVSYTFSTSSVEIAPVDIQDSYPLNLADIDIAYLEYFMYHHMQMGYESAQYRQKLETRTFSMGARSDHYNVIHDIYRVKDLPAVKNEPFSFCPKQYRLRLLYSLRLVKFPGQNPKDLSSTWEKVDGFFTGKGLVKNCTRKLKAFSDMDGIISGATKPDRIVLAIRKYVLDNVEWNGKRARIPDEGADIWKAGTGNDADITAIIACGINQLDGYKAEPVLVKLRANGYLIDFQPSANEFDRLILRIEVPGGKVYFLDAMAKDGYLNVLSPNLLTNAARLIDLNGHGSWINLEEAAPFGAGNYTVKAAFGNDSFLCGTFHKTAFHAEAMSDKQHYRKFQSRDEWTEDLEHNLTDVEVSDAAITGTDDYSNKCETELSFISGVCLGADRLYIDPFLDKFHSATTFKEPKRIMPVDFPFRYKLYYSYELTVPDGYEVEAMPEDVTMVCHSLADSFFILNCSADEGKVLLTFRFQLNTVIVQNDLYEDLRLFWEKTADAEQSIIVLKKK